MTENDKEEKRLIIALGIVATAIAAWALQPTNRGLTLGFTTVTISACLAAFYVLTTAANLKYDLKHNSTIGSYPFTEKFRKGAYDLSVDVYGYNAGVWLWYFLAFIIHKAGVSTHYFRWGFVVSAVLSITYILVFYALNRKTLSRLTEEVRT